MEITNLMDVLEEFADDRSSYKAEIASIENYFYDYLSIKDPHDEISIVTDLTDLDLYSEAELMQKTTFKMAWQVVIGSISRGKMDSRIQALNTASRLLQTEAKLLASFRTDAFYFPTQMLDGILQQLLSGDINNTQLISLFKEYTTYNDVLYYCWQILPNITPENTPSAVYISNYLEFLNIIPLGKVKKVKNAADDESDDKPKIFCAIKGMPRFHFDMTKTQRCMDKTWKHVSSWNLQESQMQRVLLVLLDHLIIHLPNPVLLTDFLMNAMDIGGAVSTLALQGVFALMQQHNLEYPLVYKKLYSMFEPQLCLSKHKSRLFYLTDIFLSSTHLPEALVAGFVKRFSRLALKFPEQDANILLFMIANLIVRHPGLGRMVAADNNGNQPLLFDPYRSDETDPSVSGAINSSLWEVADLRNHTHPAVASAAAFVLSSHHTTMEKPIGELLDSTPDDMMQEEFNKNYQQVFLATQPPHSITDSSNDRLNSHWELF